MKKIFFIDIFDASTLKYVATYKGAYATAELAQEQIKCFNNPRLKFAIVKINLINEIDFIS